METLPGKFDLGKLAPFDQGAIDDQITPRITESLQNLAGGSGDADADE